MKKNFILLCSLLASFTLQPTKTGAQTAANGQKMTYPYTFAPSEGLVNKTEKEHRQEICRMDIGIFSLSLYHRIISKAKE